MNYNIDTSDCWRVEVDGVDMPILDAIEKLRKERDEEMDQWEDWYSKWKELNLEVDKVIKERDELRRKLDKVTQEKLDANRNSAFETYTRIQLQKRLIEVERERDEASKLINDLTGL